MSFRIRALILFLLTQTFNSQSQLGFQWAKRAGAAATDWSRSMTVDYQGNVLTTGQFSGTVDFDPGPGTYTLTATGTDDVYVCKLDAIGNFLWAAQFTGNAFASSYDIITDNSGNVFTTGSFSGTVDFDPGSTTNAVAANGTYDIFVSKLDANGNYVWAKNMGGSIGAQCTGNSIAADASGNVFITGQVSGSHIDLDPGAGTYTIFSSLAIESFVCKLDAGGNFGWGAFFVGSYNDIGTGIAVDLNGDVVCTGNFQNTVDFDPGTNTYTLTSASVSTDDIYICKFSNSGTLQWARRIGDVNPDIAVSITTDASGDIYCTGQFFGVLDFDPGAGTYTLSTGGNFGWSYLLKLNAGGNFVWAKAYGGTGSSYVSSHYIAVDASKNVYTTGLFNYTIDFNPGPPTFTMDSSNGASYIQKTDSNGTFLWAKQLTASVFSSWARYGKSIHVDAARSVYIAGYFSNCDFDLSPSTYTLTSAGAEDIFVAKYCQVPELAPIVGSAIACTGGSLTYSVRPVPGVTGYSWSLPSGMLVSGNSYSVSSAAGGSSGMISVTASNVCGSGNTVSFSLTVTPSLSVSAANVTLCAPGSATLSASGANTYTWNTNQRTSTIIATQSVTTVYTVTGSAPGCADNSRTVTVSVTPVNLTVSASAYTVCALEVFTLSAAGAPNYSWSNGALTPSVPVTASATTVYTVTGSNSNCSDTTTVQVLVNPLPVIAVNSGTVCHGSVFTMMPSGASTYTFSSGSATVVPQSSSLYSVSGTSSLGCTSASYAIASVSVIPVPTISVNSGSICAGDIFTITPISSASSTFSYSTGGNTVSPGSSAAYSVWAIDSQGCVSIPAVASLTVHSLPVISVNSGSICAGQVHTITPSGAVTYSISGNSSTVSPASSANYTVVGFSAHGCKSSPVVSSLTVHSLPVMNVTPSNPTICKGETVILTASGALSYTWLAGGGVGATVAVSPAATSAFSVAGADMNGCTNSVSGVVEVDLCTGAASESSPGFQIYPNPAREELELIVQAACSFSVTNDLGQIIILGQLHEGRNGLNLEAVPSGVYTISVSNAGFRYCRRLIRQ